MTLSAQKQNNLSTEYSAAFIPFKLAVEKLGFNLGTSRNWLHRKIFPVKVHKINGLHFILSSDLIKYIAGSTTNFELEATSNPLVINRSRGRPPKNSQKKLQAQQN